MANRRRQHKYELPPESTHELPHGEEQISDETELEAEGIEYDPEFFRVFLDDLEANQGLLASNEDDIFLTNLTFTTPQWSWDEGFNFFGKLSAYPEIMMELATHLRIRPFMYLYSISKDFHAIINGHLMHTMLRCAQKRAPESARIFAFPFYKNLCTPDPVGRPNPENPTEIKLVPGLKWLQMVYHRERVVRDILAFLAREGHRCPKGMSISLKKCWFTMDLSTSKRRGQLMHNQSFWTDIDLYNIQMFCVKLEMRLNDPIDGPGDDGLRRLLLGQRGLSVMWRMFRREILKTPLDLVKMAVRYVFYREPAKQGLPMFGIPPEEIGIGHLEGWGRGRIHLYRIDELVMRESVRRNLNLKTHLRDMLLWGYVDPITHENIVPSDEEMWISDDDDEDGGTRWSDVANTGWREPSLQKEIIDWRNRKTALEAEKDDEDDDDWSTDHEDGREEMDVDEDLPSDEDGDIDDDFLESMEVDDEGRLLANAGGTD